MKRVTQWLLKEVRRRIKRAFPGVTVALAVAPGRWEARIDVYNLPENQHEKFFRLTRGIYEKLCHPLDVFGVNIFHHYVEDTRKFYAKELRAAQKEKQP